MARHVLRAARWGRPEIPRARWHRRWALPAYHEVMDPATPLSPPGGDTWLGLSAAPLPVAQALEWAVRPHCGGLVLFSGTARDHADGRPGVEVLEYEADETPVGRRPRA